MGDVGRPTLFKDEYSEQARKLCLLGYTDKQLADFFDVAESTIYKWKLEHPIFSEAIKAGKDIADGDVVDSLYNRAKGYSIEDKHYPPDPTSMIFWLKNRQPQLWRDKPVDEDQDATNATPVSVTINIEDASKREG